MTTTRAGPGKRRFYQDLSFQVLAGMALGIAVGHSARGGTTEGRLP